MILYHNNMRIKTAALSMSIVLFYTFTSICSNNDNINYVFHNNIFTYIEITAQMDSVIIYDEDKRHFPIIPKLYRGSFKLNHIRDRFYSLNSKLPGKECIDNILVSHQPDESDKVTVKINLFDVNNQYKILAKGIESNNIYQYSYSDSLLLSLPIDKDGYIFSIAPAENANWIAGITYGFSHTIKYLTIPPLKEEYFKSGGMIEISLPLFNDNIFTEWCIDGDIIQYDNDKIKFHGQQFYMY